LGGGVTQVYRRSIGWPTASGVGARFRISQKTNRAPPALKRWGTRSVLFLIDLTEELIFQERGEIALPDLVGAVGAVVDELLQGGIIVGVQGAAVERDRDVEDSPLAQHLERDGLARLEALDGAAKLRGLIERPIAG